MGCIAKCVVVTRCGVVGVLMYGIVKAVTLLRRRVLFEVTACDCYLWWKDHDGLAILIWSRAILKPLYEKREGGFNMAVDHIKMATSLDMGSNINNNEY